MTDDDALQILVALGDVRRFEIFRNLRSVTGQPAGQLADLAPSTITHHLKRMERAGVISGQRHGREMRYAISAQTLRALADWANNAAELAMLGQLSDWLNDNPQG